MNFYDEKFPDAMGWGEAGSLTSALNTIVETSVTQWLPRTTSGGPVG
jgi:hypothetical protein